MLITVPPRTLARWVQYTMSSCYAIPIAMGRPPAHLQRRCAQRSSRAVLRMPSRGALPLQPAAAATPALARPGPRSGAACAPGRGRPGRAVLPPSAGPSPAAQAPAPAPSAAAAAKAAPGAGGAGGWSPARVVVAPQPGLGGSRVPDARCPAAARAAGGPPRHQQPAASAARQAGPPGAQMVPGVGPAPPGFDQGPADAPARCAAAPGQLLGRQRVLQLQRCSSQAADEGQALGTPWQKVPGKQAAAAAAAAAAASASAAAACWQQLRLQPQQQAGAAAQPWPLKADLLWPVGRSSAACSPGCGTSCPLRAEGRLAPRVRPALPSPLHASAQTPAGRGHPRPEHPPPVPCRWSWPRQSFLRPELRAWLPAPGERPAR